MAKRPTTIRIPAQGAAGAPKPLNPQEQLAAIARGFTQQYQSIAQGVLYNLVHGYATSGNVVPAADLLVKEVLEVTDSFMANVGPACDKAFEELVVKKQAAAAEKKEGE